MESLVMRLEIFVYVQALVVVFSPLIHSFWYTVKYVWDGKHIACTSYFHDIITIYYNNMLKVILSLTLRGQLPIDVYYFQKG